MIKFNQFNQIVEHWKDDLEYYVRNSSGIGRLRPDMDYLCNKYPYQGTLYRGLNFDSPQQYLAFRRSTRDGYITINNLSSWTSEQEVARDFARNKKTYGVDLSIMYAYEKMQKASERIMGFIGVILQIEVPKGSSFDVTSTGVGAEAEVIVKPGRYRLINVEVEKQYKHLLKNIDTNDQISRWLDNPASVKQSEIDFILTNNKGAINDENKTKYMNLLSKQLSQVSFEADIEPIHRLNYEADFYKRRMVLFPTNFPSLFNYYEKFGFTPKEMKLDKRNLVSSFNKAINSLEPYDKLEIYNKHTVQALFQSANVLSSDIKPLMKFVSQQHQMINDQIAEKVNKQGERIPDRYLKALADNLNNLSIV